MATAAAKDKTKSTKEATANSASRNSASSPQSAATSKKNKPGSPLNKVTVSQLEHQVEPERGEPQTSPNAILIQQFNEILKAALEANNEYLSVLFKKDLEEATRSLKEQLQAAVTAMARQEEVITRVIGENQALTRKVGDLERKVEDMENRDRRSNLRLRGIPESYKEPEQIVSEIISKLAPELPQENLMLDRVHRALTRRKPEDPPRDIIIKFHYYRTKEKVQQGRQPTLPTRATHSRSTQTWRRRP